MARNILAVWDGDRSAIREAAREHALQFSWNSSMEALFGRVYPSRVRAPPRAPEGGRRSRGRRGMSAVQDGFTQPS